MRRSIALLLAAAGALTTTSSAHAADACPNAQFRTGAGASLPECRAWEQVSPLDKNGGRVFESTTVKTIGERAAYQVRGSFPGSDGAVVEAAVLSRRSASGWATQGVDPPIFNPRALLVFSVLNVTDDLSHALVVSNRALTPDASEGRAAVYIRDLDGGFRRAFGIGNDFFTNKLGNETMGSQDAAFTDDLKHFTFRSPEALTAGATSDGATNLYQWDDGTLRLASVLPDGRAAPLGFDNAVIGSPYSSDGRRLTMRLQSETAPGSGTFVTAAYQRVDGGRTTLISRSHRTGADDDAPVDVGPAWASPDGTTVTFSDRGAGPLTDESPADGSSRLYRWHADGDRLEDLLAGVVPDDQPTPGYGISEISSDGRFVWLSSSDGLSVLDTARERLSPVDPYFASDFTSGVRYNRAGTRAVIVSQRGLYTFDAEAPAAGATCVTCALPAATTAVRVDGGGLATFGGAVPHPITDDGRVFFDSPDRLVPQDTNSVSDVYGYVPGQGVRLISSGTGEEPSIFKEVSPTGEDVFFVTRNSLVGQDTDDLTDLYDARVGGGLAAQQTPSPVTPCQGDACRGAAASIAAPPVPATPAPPTAPRPAFALLKPSAAERRAAARRGRMRVTVRATVAGKAAVRASARIGGRARSVASSSRSVARRGSAVVTLRLSARARRVLRRVGKLRLSLSATFSAVAGRDTVSVTLRRPRPASGRVSR